MDKITNFIKKKAAMLAMAALAVIGAMVIVPAISADAANASSSLTISVISNWKKPVSGATITWQKYTATSEGTSLGDAVTFTTDSDGIVRIPQKNLEMGSTYYYTVTPPDELKGNYKPNSSENMSGYVWVNSDPQDSTDQFSMNSSYIVQVDVVLAHEDSGSDDGDGSLKITLKKHEIYFQNSFEGVKYDEKTPTEGAYEFSVYKSTQYGTATGDALAVAKNDAEGNVVFDAIKFTKDDLTTSGSTKQLRLLVSETTVTDAGMHPTSYGYPFRASVLLYITLDSDQISNLENGKAVEIEYSDDVYNISYPAVGFHVYAIKNLVDEKGNALDVEKDQFSFTMIGPGKSDTKTVKNNEKGISDLGTFKYTSQGRHNNSNYEYCFVYEEAGTDSSITYDKNDYSVGGTSFGSLFMTKAQFDNIKTSNADPSETGSGSSYADVFRIIVGCTYTYNGEIYTSNRDLVNAGIKAGDEYTQTYTYATSNYLWNVSTTDLAMKVDSWGVSSSKFVSSTGITNLKKIGDNVVINGNDGSIVSGNINYVDDSNEDNVHYWPIVYTFTNVKDTSIKDPDPISVSFHTTKKLTDATETGRVLQADEFEFQLLDENGTVLKTAKNKADGNIDFGTIEYSAKDVGTHTYTIHEVEGNVAGVTYDKNDVSVTVVISLTESNTLKVEATFTKSN